MTCGASAARPCADQMRCLRSDADLKASNDLFGDAVGFRHALVLPKVIEPGVGQKGLDETTLLRGILEYPQS